MHPLWVCRLEGARCPEPSPWLPPSRHCGSWSRRAGQLAPRRCFSEGGMQNLQWCRFCRSGPPVLFTLFLVVSGAWTEGQNSPKAERSSKATPYPTEEVREDLSIIPRREYLFNLMSLVPLHQVPRAQIYASASESHAELPRCLAAVSDKPFLDSSQF